MDPPLLKLVFVKGPREGETLEFKPGSAVRVGRIARGNDLAIKDAGISTKHLRIESDSGNWIIRDLGSSNGTALNSTSLSPDTPFDLRHGDMIKLGEYTSILVNFAVYVQGNGTDDVQEHKLPPRPRRNNRRQQAAVYSNPVASVQENPTRKGRLVKQGDESGYENEQIQEIAGRGMISRKRIVDDIAEEVEVSEDKDEKKGNSRARRTRKKGNSENLCLDEKKVGNVGNQQKVHEEKDEERGNSRVRRSSKTGSTQSSSLDLGKLEVMEGENEKKSNSRTARSSKKTEIAQSSCLDSGNVEIANVATEAPVEVKEEKDEKTENPRATRRSKRKELAGDPYLELERIQKEAKNRRGRKKKMEQKPLEGVEATTTTVDKDTDLGGEAQNSTVEGYDENEQDLGINKRRGFETVEPRSDAGKERCDKKESAKASGAKMTLEKMTLGDLLDCWEFQLKKQIIDETEKMLQAMRTKHRRTWEYIKEQKKNKKAKLLVV